MSADESDNQAGEGIPANAYCERLGIAVPSVEDVLDRMKKPNLFHLLIAVLVERGAPMTLNEVADRLLVAGFERATGDMVLSLQKAWRGREPVFRDPDQRLRLDLGHPEMDLILFRAGMRGARAVVPPETAVAPAPPASPMTPPVGEDVPLTEDELSAAFRGRSLGYGTSQRQAAAVLDVRQRPMALTELEEILAAFTPHRAALKEGLAKWWRTGMVRRQEDGRFLLDPTPGSAHVASMRRAVRKLAAIGYARQAEEERRARAFEAGNIARAQRRRQEVARAAGLRRVILRALPEGKVPRALTLLDVETRALHTLVGDDLGNVGEILAPYDVLIGLHLREQLFAMGLEPDRWGRLVDLKPPQKTIRINQRGRTLAITPEMLMRATVGTSKPLGEPTVLAKYLAQGDHGKLARRLEADAKALYAFYRYGVLHGEVMLRWGFLNTSLPVDWAERGDLGIYEQLKHAMEVGEPVEVVLGGSAPGWEDPWSRGQIAWVQGVRQWDVVLRLADEVQLRDRRDIQAIRPARAAAPSVH
jgi:hypothetical protein